MIPALFTAEVREPVDGAEDDFGNPVQSWTAWASHAVYGWGAPDTAEPAELGHDREIADVELLVPPEFPEVSHSGQVRLDGVLFELIGSVQRWDHNPFGWNPGGVLNLRKVAG